MRRWFPVFWMVLGVAVVVGDFFTGPQISLSILFVFPVALATRLSGRWWGCGLALLLPLAHFGFNFLWHGPWTLDEAVANAVIRIGVLVIVAVLIDWITRHQREIKVLRGLLPVCPFCKKIRTEDQCWQSIESYITAHTGASFTHTFCPECFQEHYGMFVQKHKAAESHEANVTPEQPDEFDRDGTNG